MLSHAAFAADMAIAPPPAYAPAVVEDFGGWYLRGDIGFSNQRVDRLNNALDVNNTSSVQRNNFNTAGIFGLGVGYKVNNWFRADVTGEWCGNSQFHGTDRISYVGGVGTDTYHATKNEWVVLANAYVDLGTWNGITPYIGAGVGTSNIEVSNYRYRNPNGVKGTWKDGNDWAFSWAAMAGLAYAISPNMMVDFNYRYLSIGDGRTGNIPIGTGRNPVRFDDLAAHEFRVGFRYMID